MKYIHAFILIIISCVCRLNNKGKKKQLRLEHLMSLSQCSGTQIRGGRVKRDLQKVCIFIVIIYSLSGIVPFIHFINNF